jgi:hypothetical protein
MLIAMRINKSFLSNTLPVVLFVVGLSGCTKNFNNLNISKDVISVSTINSSTLGPAFADAEYYGFIGNTSGWELMHELHASIYSQLFTTTSAGFNTDQFLEDQAWVDAGWSAFYAGPAVMINFVQQYTAANKMPAENAIANIWTVPIYERMTDFFGPVIFSHFGNDSTSVAYDPQDSVYNRFFRILDTAVSVLQNYTSSTPFGNNDIVYGGNVSKWIAYANSLRLRLAMRIVYANPTLAQQEAEKAVAAGTITGNTGNAQIATTANNLNYLTQWTYINPFCMSATDASILIGFNDPRLTSFWNSGGGLTGGTLGYNGLRNGLTAAMKTTAIRSGAAGNSFVAKPFFSLANGGTNPPVPIMTAAEVCFLKAEGALRGWNMGGTAASFYNQGITNSLGYWTTASAATISSYITSTNTPVAVPDGIVAATFNTPPESNITVAYETGGSFETQLEQIITQKWLDSFLSPWEAWAERRRTGYPRGYAVINSLDPTIPVTSIIRRMEYPPSEYTNNSKAVAAAVTNLLGGADLTMTRVWWDQKPLADFPDLSSTVVH